MLQLNKRHARALLQHVHHYRRADEFIFYQRRRDDWKEKTRVRITLFHAEKIAAQEYAIQLECAWACKFHVHVHLVARGKPEEESQTERINKSALSDMEHPVKLNLRFYMKKRSTALTTAIRSPPVIRITK